MYSISNKNGTDGEILQSDAGFTFIDFLPKVIQPGGIFTSNKYENFRALIDRVNQFLRSNTKWKIVTCESVQFRGSKVDPIKVTFKKDLLFPNSYVRGLRLWLAERKDEKETEQQIGYINLLPQKLESGGIFGSPKFETLNAMIQKFNSNLKYNPLPGRIITIESKQMPFTNFEKFDPDISSWSENGKGYGNFVFVIRIFYEIMDSPSEEIGIRDFIPGKISTGDFFSSPEYQPFSSIMNRASSWLSQEAHLRVCNVQTVEMKLRAENAIEGTQKMAFLNNAGSENYIRILRVAYTKPLFHSEKVSQITQLTCRDFVPVQLKTGIFAFDYENIVITKERISRWVKESGAHVVCAETTTYRVKSGGERKQGTDATFSTDPDGMTTDEYWIFIVRLYLDGVYKEPPPESLPPVPKIPQSSCQIS